MDLKKIGNFFKELRREKNLTQQELAEKFNVSNRTVSRWETGSNMPDLDIIIEMSYFYEVDISELLDGERKNEKMDKKTEETVLKVADYTAEDKEKLLKALHIYSLIGFISMAIFAVLEFSGATAREIWDSVASFALGLATSMFAVGLLFTSTYIFKVRAFKKRLTNRR
jgi:transcriptional regulator with XRE-family HTH domain